MYAIYNADNNPDYNQEVIRISKGKKATYNHLKMSNYKKQFPALSGRSRKTVNK